MATVAFGVGTWFALGWPIALMVSAVWVLTLVVLFGGGE